MYWCRVLGLGFQGFRVQGGSLNNHHGRRSTRIPFRTLESRLISAYLLKWCIYSLHVTINENEKASYDICFMCALAFDAGMVQTKLQEICLVPGTS